MKTTLLASLVTLTLSVALFVSSDIAAVPVAASGALLALMFVAHRIKTSPGESAAIGPRPSDERVGASGCVEEHIWPIYDVDLRSRAFVRVPAELRKAWGAGHAELYAAGGYDLFEARVHPEDLPASRRRFAPEAPAPDEARSAGVDLRIMDGTGRYRWWRDSARIVPDAQGRPQSLSGALIEITDLKEAESRAGGDGDPFDALEPAHSGASAHAQGEPGPFEAAAAGNRPGGARAMSGADERNADITARADAVSGARRQNEALEMQVAERTAQLGAALKELDSFSYSVSHDLRDPLRAIDGYSSILMSEYGERLDSEAWMLLQRIRSGVHRMSDLIDDLMELARVSRYPLKREEIDLSALAESVARELQEAEPSRHVEVEVASGLVVRADPKLLRIALENLIGNAWKFTARTDRAHIRVGRREDESGAAWFFVEDNGAGFDIRHVDKLFTPFQRLHHERDFSGTGIGLAMVARIVHRHGGRVAAHNESETTRFAFTLSHGEPASEA